MAQGRLLSKREADLAAEEERQAARAAQLKVHEDEAPSKEARLADEAAKLATQAQVKVCPSCK